MNKVIKTSTTLAALALAAAMPFTVQAQPLDRTGTVIATTTVGAATGAVIGQQNHQAAQGALIGGVLGSMVGLILVDAHAQPVQVAHHPRPAPQAKKVIVRERVIVQQPQRREVRKEVARHEARERHERMEQRREARAQRHGYNQRNSRYEREVAYNRGYERDSYRNYRWSHDD